jgi:UDP-perosamine 4-acetyltransferase
VSESVVVLGAGGHGKVVINALQVAGVKVVACLDAARDQQGRSVLGVQIVGGDERLSGFPPGEVLLANGVGSVGDVTVRRGVFERMHRQRYRFVTVRHPSAVIAPDADLGEGVQVMAGAVIQPGCRIGVNGIINTGASVDHDCKLGDHVHVAPGAVLSGEVVVGDESHIGVGATVKQGVRIGKGAIVAAGAVVVDDVPDGVTVAGVPAAALGKKP